MSGVVSGTAIMLPKGREGLHTITLTVNNQCNLHCPHCYLRYNGDNNLVSRETIDFIFKPESLFRHLVIAGKEPFFDRRSAEICRIAISEAESNGISMSLITNGINVPFLGADGLSAISFLDISLDGGKIFYPQYRGVPISRLETSLSWLKTNGFSNYNALEILNNLTLRHIDDMMELAI